jgi:ubiquinone/menaquinone biosynthesis C-methylase UbiE/DNA-binding transcriptional ArsR family regulator
MESVLNSLRAVAESTRLRLLLLCARGELTVTELTDILGQSQPRVSRHLKLLCDAGLLDRFREGTWVYYRVASRGRAADLARQICAAVPMDDPTVALDQARLETVKRQRAEAANAYFRANAEQWDQIRSLHIDEREVEAAVLEALGSGGIGDLLDLGTGTGRMLEIVAPRVEHAIGIDLSREMLAVARANLEKANLRNCTIRQGDIYQLPFADQSFDAAIFHQVLHYADRPSLAIAEAARMVRPDGRLVIVDFAPHALEFLRAEHAHRHLGFADAEISGWCRETGLVPEPVRYLIGQPLTVAIWVAWRNRDTKALEKPSEAGISRAASS